MGKLQLASACVISGFAFLAGCSPQQTGPSALPTNSSGAAQPSSRSKMSAAQFLQLEISGKIRTPLSRAVLIHDLKIVTTHPRPKVRFDAHAQVGLWVSQPDYDYIFGQTSKGTKTVTAIDAGYNNCSRPQGLKVDHSHNLWVACYDTGGPIQEYAPGSSTPAAAFNDGYECGSYCYFQGAPNDVAVDGSSHVFAANSSSQNCTYTSCNDDGSISWWNASSPSSSPSVLYDPNLYDVDFIDTDSSGNLYADGYGCVGYPSSTCGNLVDKISNPTSASPTFTTIVLPGTIEEPAGVYVSNASTVLNVVDEEQRTVSRYRLPSTGSESAFKVLGPTFVNKYGWTEPISGGFNQADNRIAIADGWGWINIGNPSSNKWVGVSNPNFSWEGIYGAAYVPSDK